MAAYSRQGWVVALFLIALLEPLAIRAEELAPVESESVFSYEAQLFDFSGPAAPWTPGPESTLPPEVLEELKKAPGGEIPDEIVPLVFPKKGRSVAAAAKPGGDISLETSEATVLRSYAGLDYAASLGADGADRRPDTTLAKSTSRVLEGTNSALRLFMANGSVLATTSLNSFFGANAAEGVLFDPRVLYDQLGPNKRFFIVALQRYESVTSKTARIYIAVSRTADPSNFSTISSWCTYQIDSVRDSGTTWADFPMIGVGADAFLLSNDQWTFDLNPNPNIPQYEYKYGILRVVRKDLITNNALSCPALSSSIFLLPIQLTGTAGSDMTMGHVQPALHYTTPSSFPVTTNPVYMVSTFVPPSSIYKVWRVKNAATGSPTVSVVSLTASNPYHMPPDAQQPPVAFALDTNDTRVLQVAALGDTLWAVHETRCEAPNGFLKSCVRVMKFGVGDVSGNLTASIQHDVTFASPAVDTTDYYMPSIAVNSSQQTAISFLASSTSLYQGAAWTVKYALDQVYAPATVYASGACSRTFSGVGDFVGAQTNPNDLSSIWLAAEAAAPYGSSCTWRTQIIQVSP